MLYFFEKTLFLVQSLNAKESLILIFASACNLWELSQLDLTRQEFKLDVKKVKYRNFFNFCIIFLIESHEEKTWRSFDRKS